MKKIVCSALIFLSFSAQATAKASTPNWVRLWEIGDLPNPESVVYDQKRDVMFVSFQAYGAKPGSGAIGKLSTDGKILVKGLPF